MGYEEFVTNPDQNWFLDLRNHNFFRVASVSPATKLGRPLENVAAHVALCEEAYFNQGAQLIVFPELSLAGYTIQDAFLHESLLKSAKKAIKLLLEKTAHINAIIAFGAPVSVHDSNYNCIVVVLRGEILGIIAKTYIPNYGEFTELRWFRSAQELPVSEINFLGQTIPIGNDLIFASSENPDITIGGEICEDGWMILTPNGVKAMSGAHIVFNCSASNFEVGKSDWREHLVKRSGEMVTGCVYTGAGSESSTSMIFEHHHLMSQSGKMIGELEAFDPDPKMLVADIDLQTLISHRRRMNTFASQLRIVNPPTQRWIWFDGYLGLDDTHIYDYLAGQQLDCDPFVPKSDKEFADLSNARVLALYLRFAALPPHLRKAVLGLSGGKDSTDVLLLLVRMVQLYGERLGMSLSDITCLSMPGFGTTKGTRSYTSQLADNFSGIDFHEIGIEDLANFLFTVCGFESLLDAQTAMQEDPDLKTVFENGQAWIRKVIELTTSAKGGIVIGTTCLSEALIGWFTIFGDSAAHYAPNIGVAKSAVETELLWLAENVFNQPELAELIKEIAHSASTPELGMVDENGNAPEMSDDKNGPDRVRDFFAYQLLRLYRSPSSIFRLSLEAYQNEYSSDQLFAWLYRFLDRFVSNRFKSNTLSVDGPKVGTVANGAHDMIKWPSDMSSQALLWDLLDNVPDEYK